MKYQLKTDVTVTCEVVDAGGATTVEIPLSVFRAAFELAGTSWQKCDPSKDPMFVEEHSCDPPAECPECIKLRAMVRELRNSLGHREKSLTDSYAENERLKEQVHHWLTKADCYGNIVHGCSPVLAAAGHPVDSSGTDGSVGGISRAIEALVAERDELKKALRANAPKVVYAYSPSNESIATLTKERDELKKRLDDYTNVICDRNNEVADQKTRYDVLKDANTTLSRRIDELVAERDELKRSNEALTEHTTTYAELDRSAHMLDNFAIDVRKLASKAESTGQRASFILEATAYEVSAMRLRRVFLMAPG